MSLVGWQDDDEEEDDEDFDAGGDSDEDSEEEESSDDYRSVSFDLSGMNAPPFPRPSRDC